MDLIGTILQVLDSELNNREIKPINAHWPSQASFVHKETVGGKCLRASYFHRNGIPGTPIDPETGLIFARGGFWEDWAMEKLASGGVDVYHSVKFRDILYAKGIKPFKFNEMDINPKKIDIKESSCEIDAIAIQNDELVGIECKTVAGSYYSTKNYVNAVDAKPKVDAVMQAASYLEYCQRFDELLLHRTYNNFLGKYQWIVTEEEKNSKIIASPRKFKLFYIVADGSSWRQYDLTLKKIDGESYPVVDGILMPEFSVQDIYRARITLDYLIQNQLLPPCSYYKTYSKEKVKELYQTYLKETKAKKKETLSSYGSKHFGDWNCSAKYCSWREICELADDGEWPPSEKPKTNKKKVRK